ncbi:hypothetical protein E5676_scaffold477G00300 [Cucumis melo var. makuwa]|uniref:Protein Ycf2-like n=1 Tax=Cucumis melo var. makuwa TaxID=1194695 RepID=A0A5D3CVR6_CUCMM|nr:hypothetical protein E5676_scaffold477G00300 [Cucumis melo var. makuwa]
MIDDEETLLNFPWGRLSFNLTVEYMRKAAEDLTVNFSLQGFPHVLVCWALEIIPKLSESPNGIATRIGHRSRRIINWKLEQQPVWTYLQRNYFKSSDFTVIPFTPTSDELTSPNFQFFLNDAPNEVEKERSEETEDENDKGDEEETVNDETKKSLRKEIQEVKKDLESLKNTVENGQNEVLELLNNIITIINERMPTEKQSQGSYHENHAPTLSLQRLEERMNIHNLDDAEINEEEIEQEQNAEELEQAIKNIDKFINNNQEDAKKNEEEIENQEVNAEDQPMNPENEDKNNEKDNEEKQMNEVSKEAHHPTIGESEEQPNERELDGKELMETSLKLVEDILKIREEKHQQNEEGRTKGKNDKGKQVATQNRVLTRKASQLAANDEKCKVQHVQHERPKRKLKPTPKAIDLELAQKHKSPKKGKKSNVAFEPPSFDLLP